MHMSSSYVHVLPIVYTTCLQPMYIVQHAVPCYIHICTLSYGYVPIHLHPISIYAQHVLYISRTYNPNLHVQRFCTLCIAQYALLVHHMSFICTTCPINLAPHVLPMHHIVHMHVRYTIHRMCHVLPIHHMPNTMHHISNILCVCTYVQSVAHLGGLGHGPFGNFLSPYRKK